MIQSLKTNIGKLRLIGFLEGTSLILLVFIGTPLKYISQNTELVKILGPIHGALFLIYVFNTFSVAISEKWEFKKTTWKVLIACLIPFGTFYIDKKILAPLSK